MNIDNYNHDMCKLCGGACCQRSGCNLNPSDFNGKLTKKRIKDLINTGLVSIDYWDGDPRPGCNRYSVVFYLRMRNLNSLVFDRDWHSTCVLFNKDIGCPLRDDVRPHGGKFLIPDYHPEKPHYNDKYKCHMAKGCGGRECIIDWIKIRKILNPVVYSIMEREEKGILYPYPKTEEGLKKAVEKFTYILTTNEYNI